MALPDVDPGGRRAHRLAADDPVVRVDEEPDEGLSKAFRDAWGGFTSGVEALVAASGRAVLVLLCAALAFVVLRLVWRVSRRRLV